MKWLFSSLTAILMLSAPATAQGFSAEALAQDCRADASERTVCLAYLEGYAQGYVRNDRIMTDFLRDNVQSGHLLVAAQAKRVDKLSYCADDLLPGEMIREAYLDWADAHPEALDQPASTALFLALAEAFPCSGPPAADASYQAASLHP